MPTRRTFVSSMLGAGVSLPVMRESAFRQLFHAEPIAAGRAAVSVAEDETYWREIQRAFDLDRTMINLNNGGCSPAPTHVLEQMIRDLRFSNELPVEHMWRVLEPRIESVRRDLATDFGCDPEEMAITRNASEANEIDDLRPRPPARRRGDLHDAELSAHAERVAAARAARRDRAQAA